MTDHDYDDPSPELRNSPTALEIIEKSVSNIEGYDAEILEQIPGLWDQLESIRAETVEIRRMVSTMGSFVIWGFIGIIASLWWLL